MNSDIRPGAALPCWGLAPASVGGSNLTEFAWLVEGVPLRGSTNLTTINSLKG